MALQTKEKTISALHTLQIARDAIREQLQDAYSEKITPFADIIIKVMNANNINEFDAIAKIKNELAIYKTPGAELFFACALTEIVEEKHFVGLKR